MDLQIKTHEIFGKKKKKRFSNPLRQKTHLKPFLIHTKGLGSFKSFVEEGRMRTGVTEKRTKTNRESGVLACVYVRFFKKMLSFSY